MSFTSWENWVFAFSVTLPNLLMLLLGIALKKMQFLDEVFCDKATKLVFNISLPCLLFLSIALNQKDITPYLPLALFAAVSTLLSYFLLELVAPWLIPHKRERGIFVQAGFRSNAAIIGLAYSAAAYGSQGVTLGSIYIISTVILYNILSVITLTRSLSDAATNRANTRLIIKSIVKNPLILAILSGLPFSLLMIPLPDTLVQTGKLVANLALPLALLCTGASLDWSMMFRSSGTALKATIARIVAVPALITLCGGLAGFKGTELGVIFLLTASPAAAASYIMTRFMGGNATLAANIIAMTTIGSFFTTAIGLYYLRSYALI